MKRMQKVKKQLLLTDNEVDELLSIIKKTDCSQSIIEKIEKLSQKEENIKYVPIRDMISDVAFRLTMKEYANNPLEYKYSTKKVTNVRDYSKTLYTVHDDRYIVQVKKENELFKHRWEAKLYGYKRHKMQLEKKLKTIKSEKFKVKYVEKIKHLDKEITRIENNPDKILKMMVKE